MAKNSYAKTMTSKIPLNQGRNKELLHHRNRLIAARYYYHFYLKRVREDDVFNKISEHEVFLAPDTIYRILIEQNDFLNELIKQKASVAKLQRSFPGFRF